MKVGNVISLTFGQVFLFFSCAGAQSSEGMSLKPVAGIENTLPDKEIDLSRFYQRDSVKTYNDMKAEIQAEKRKLSLDKITEDSLGKWFCNHLVYGILPYWYGTPWDFNGYTATPNEGVIACGYLVSTTLQHMGLRVNRYKLAQQLPIHEAQTLALDNDLLTVEGTTEQVILQLDSLLEDGIYFLGFDQSHVGFLLREKNGLYVIHANYIGSGGVAVEPISACMAFSYSARFYIAPVSTNRQLMKSWLSDEIVTVVEG